MQPSVIEFRDSLSGAFCRLYETVGKDGSVANHVEHRVAGTAGSFIKTYAGSQWDAAWKEYRSRLNEVLESVEKWDNE